MRMKGDLFRLRPMVSADLFAVCAIERDSFARPWSAQALTQELDLPQSRQWVAVCEDELVGYLIYWQVTDQFQLLDIAVKKTTRRQGAAGLLLDHLLREVDGLLDSVVLLEVASGNLPARALYASRGFSDCGVRTDYYGPGEDAVLLERQQC